MVCVAVVARPDWISATAESASAAASIAPAAKLAATIAPAVVPVIVRVALVQTLAAVNVLRRTDRDVQVIEIRSTRGGETQLSSST